ncbi:unnamed protein product [Microthlaspi erraticum]|uniref:Uncharacterized protein n=1 Tax=Microthlaspi erraticum TaxID=1685480 RepID=A0A6D2IMG2_9BRAS|nr:unnamed protein product [Microthlaspi erraticum]
MAMELFSFMPKSSTINPNMANSTAVMANSTVTAFPLGYSPLKTNDAWPQRSHCANDAFTLFFRMMWMLFDTQFNDVHGQCGCLNEKTCGLRYSTSEKAAFCAIPNPPQMYSFTAIASRDPTIPEPYFPCSFPLHRE